MASPISLITQLSAGIQMQTTGTEICIATLKKTNDVAKLEGEALVQMIEDSLPQTNRLLDLYA
jgi:hypothetical protein